MEAWDDDNFEPDVPVTGGAAVVNKWEGEDEEDDIKESWEDEDEEKLKEDDEEKAIQKPKKKSLAEKIAEKERSKQEQLEQALKEAEEEEDISAEEKLRRQKESDLKLALDTTFGDSGSSVDGITCPTTSEEFDEFAAVLIKKIQPLTKSAEFPNFAENFVRDICATLSSFDIKKIKTTVDNLYLEKQKLEKGDKVKKNKGKGKVKLKVEDNNQYSAYAVDDFDYDDFM